jgi:hypothetical protein
VYGYVRGTRGVGALMQGGRVCVREMRAPLHTHTHTDTHTHRHTPTHTHLRVGPAVGGRDGVVPHGLLYARHVPVSRTYEWVGVGVWVWVGVDVDVGGCGGCSGVGLYVQ